MPGRSGPSVGGNTWWRLKHRESGYRHSRGQGIGEVHSENPDTNPSRLFGETGVRNMKRVRIFDIRRSEFLRSKELGHHKSRNPGEIRTIHQRRMRGSNRRHRGKSREEVIDWRLGHRDIGDPGEKVFMQDGITKSETPMSGS